MTTYMKIGRRLCCQPGRRIDVRRQPIQEGDPLTPRRPSTHVISDQSLLHFHQAFLSRGWAIEELDKDYGQDLLVRIFDAGQATPYSFYVQVKAVTDANRIRTADGGYLRFRCRRDNFDHWLDFWEPVVLAVWDPSLDIAYWEIVQEPERRWDERRANCYCYIPLDNRLDRNGLRRLENRTKRRHQRYEDQRAGARILIEKLEEALGVKIEYNPEAGVLIIERPEGGADISIFGKLAHEIESRKRNPSQFAFRAVNDGIRLLESLDEGHPFTVKGDAGEAVTVRDSAEFWRHLRRCEDLH
jgi:hypothetical protein